MIRKYLLIGLWVLLIVFLILVSSTFRNRKEAMMAVVESQVTAISFQKPVVIVALPVVPGQEIRKGDTILKVSRPDLTLDIEKKENEIQRLRSEMLQKQQSFEGKSALIQIETQGKIKRLQTDLLELTAKLERQKAVVKRLGPNPDEAGSPSYYDTLSQVKAKSIADQINSTQQYARREMERLERGLLDELRIGETQVVLAEKELQALKEEYELLQKVAQFDGIVGTVNVQLDELVQPFTKVISIYEQHPSLIKAYMNEEITYEISPGDEVEVVSENRSYKIQGVVLELGARVVSYPTKIEPMSTTKSYGQEVFISISNENDFLNGEKVFVYPTDSE